MVGPSGHWQDDLARAMREKGCPVFFIRGSDFVEMFVGVGASRVRDMFDPGEEVRATALSLRGVTHGGRHRGHGVGGGGHDDDKRGKT